MHGGILGFIANIEETTAYQRECVSEWLCRLLMSEKELTPDSRCIVATMMKSMYKEAEWMHSHIDDIWAAMRELFMNLRSRAPGRVRILEALCSLGSNDFAHGNKARAVFAEIEDVEEQIRLITLILPQVSPKMAQGIVGMHNF